MNGLLRFLLLLGGMLLACEAWAAPLMRDGLWEIGTRMEMPDMPKGMRGMGPNVQQRCFTKEDVRDNKSVAPLDKNDKNCKVKSSKVSGNKVSWEVQCKDRQEAKGEAVFSGDSYEGVMRSRHPGMQGEMVMHYAGRRIGDCK